MPIKNAKSMICSHRVVPCFKDVLNMVRKCEFTLSHGRLLTKRRSKELYPSPRSSAKSTRLAPGKPLCAVTNYKQSVGTEKWEQLRNLQVHLGPLVSYCVVDVTTVFMYKFECFSIWSPPPYMFR